MPIQKMTREDLDMVLGWAAREGWNPGQDDADAFFAADPDGFFLNVVNGQPAASISVVNHTHDFAFLGLYICDPAFRGQGHGLAVWQAALHHAGGRCVGLDGVPDQQENYRRSGFAGSGRTVRYQGSGPGWQGCALRRATEQDLPALLAFDRAASGLARPAYMRRWFEGAPTRVTLVSENGQAAATYRQCINGMKIGPLFATESADALALLGATPFGAGSRPVFVDVPEECTALSALVRAKGFTPAFETARMYTGSAPPARPPAYHAITTLELG